MTVRINKPALNLREELTKAQGVVRYEQRQFWMDGLVENGTFDTDTSGWTTGTIVNSQLVLTTPLGVYYGYSRQYLSGLQDGKSYRLVAELVSATTATHNPFVGYYGSNSDNSLRVSDSFVVGGQQLLSFTFTYISSVDTLPQIRLYVGGQDATTVWDNVKVFEVDENDNVIHSVPLGFKPVHVYEDGLLQREGTNHDYTVVDTGFGYQVKPTVAPSATTETCVIAEREL